VAASGRKALQGSLAPSAAFLLAALGHREAAFPALGDGAPGGLGVAVEEEGNEEADAAAVEGGVVESVVALVLRMNEHELGRFFVDVHEWKLQGEAAAAAASAAPVGAAAAASLCRRVTFFRVVEALAQRLKSIFAPFFDGFFEDCRKELDAPFALAAAEEWGGDGGKQSAKKRRRLAR